MSAGSESYSSQRSRTCTATVDITGTTPQYTLPFGLSFQISEAFAIITVLLTTTSGVITVKRNRLAGLTTSDTSIGTFTLPIGGTLGDVYRVDMRTAGDTFLAPGETISFESDGVPAAGTAWFGVIGYETRFGNDPYPFQSFSETDKDRSGVGTINYLAFTEV